MNIEVIKVAITQKTTQQLIELRDEGMSYDKLAKKLKLSKTSLVAWSRKYELDMSNTQFSSQLCLQL